MTDIFRARWYTPGLNFGKTTDGIRQIINSVFEAEAKELKIEVTSPDVETITRDMATMTELCEAVHDVNGWMEINGPVSIKARYVDALQAYRDMTEAKARAALKAQHDRNKDG